MQFSDITKSVQDAWHFAWPPLVLSGITYFVARYFHADGTDAVLQRVAENIKDYGAKLDSVRAVLEPYGLTKLVPIVSVVAFIGFIYLLNGPLTIAVSNIPPHLSYQPDKLITRSLSENERLLLIRKYPTVRSLSEAYYLALDSAR